MSDSRHVVVVELHVKGHRTVNCRVWLKDDRLSCEVKDGQLSRGVKDGRLSRGVKDGQLSRGLIPS